MSNKLVDLFDFLDEAEKVQLDFLNIDKIDYRKKISRLDVYLSGGEYLSEENLLALVFYKAKTVFECDVRFIFNNFEDKAHALKCLSGLIKSELSLENFEYCQLATSSSFELDGSKIEIHTDELNKDLTDVLLNAFAKSVCALFLNHTGFKVSDASFVFEQNDKRRVSGTCFYGR